MAMTTALDAAEKVRSTLRENGFQAYFVGGCVRDLLLGRTPKDYDVTTDATPDEVEGCFLRTIPLGKAFGVMVVLVPNDGNTADFQIEVATFRADGDYNDGRRPDTVTYSREAQDDVVRRDFTINGLLSTGPVDPSESIKAYEAALVGCTDRVTISDKTFGIIDHVGGIADLDAQRICCIGDPRDRFAEDALRMLRAVRFAAQLGFEIEPKTEAAIRDKAPTISRVSKERIAAELLRLVAAPFPVKGLVPLAATGLLYYIIPTLGYNGNFITTLRRFTNFPTTNPLKGMAMLLAEIELDAAYNVCHDLKLSGEQIEVIENALRHGGRINNLDVLPLADMKRLARKPGIQIGLDLFEQEVALGHQLLNPKFKNAISRMRDFTPEELCPKPLVTGDDLIDMGLKPGPNFTKLLGAAETAQLNGTLTTPAGARLFVENMLLVES
jgi:poly(A) polymerase